MAPPSHPPRLFGASLEGQEPSCLLRPTAFGLLPERRGEPCDVGHQLRVRPPSIVWLPSKQHHPYLPRVDEGTRHSAKETPASCRLPSCAPPKSGSPSIQSALILGARCRQVELTQLAFATTLPRQIRTPALSTAKPRLPPALAHATRWWPKATDVQIGGEAQAAEQEDPELVGINPIERLRWSGRQWHSCQRSAFRSIARSLSVNRGKKDFNTLEEASCSHQWRKSPDSESSGSRRNGRWPSARSSQDGGSKPFNTDQLACHRLCCHQCGQSHGVSHPEENRRATSDHGKAITCPECRRTRTAFRRLTKSQRHRGIVPTRWICIENDLQDVPQATPQSIRMAFSECLDCLRPDHPQHVLRASTCTTQEESTPTASSTMRMHVMFQNFPQKRLDEVWVAHRRSQRCDLATRTPSTPWHLESVNCAIRSNQSHAGGRIPAAFQT